MCTWSPEGSPRGGTREVGSTDYIRQRYHLDLNDVDLVAWFCHVKCGLRRVCQVDYKGMIMHNDRHGVNPTGIWFPDLEESNVEENCWLGR